MTHALSLSRVGYTRIQSLFYEYAGDSYDRRRHSAAGSGSSKNSHDAEEDGKRDRRGSSEIRDESRRRKNSRLATAVSADGLDTYGGGRGRAAFDSQSPPGRSNSRSGSGGSGGHNSPKRRAAPAMPLPEGTVDFLLVFCWLFSIKVEI